MKYIRQVKKQNNNGINIDPKKITHSCIISELEEYFIYTPGGNNQYGGGPTKGIKMTRDSITYCTSGLVDRNKGSTLEFTSYQTSQPVDDD